MKKPLHAMVGAQESKAGDQRTYRLATSRPDSFSRGVLAGTAQVLRTSDPILAQRLDALLSSAPISKPMLHHGGPETDFFPVDFSIPEAEAITDALSSAEVDAVAQDGSTTPLASHYASLLDSWVVYLEHLDRTDE